MSVVFGAKQGLETEGDTVDLYSGEDWLESQVVGWPLGRR